MSEQPSVTTEHGRILVVEDEPSVAENIVYALETEGFDPVWVSTGGEGRSRLRETPEIALVVLDVGLPDVNGFDLCRDIRGFSKVPVIFLTARSDEIDRVVGLELGADDYMVKPFSPRELAARVKAVLRRTRNGDESETPPAGFPFQVDAERCRIVYFGTALSLTRYEYKLLEVLVRKPGRIYSRDLLMDRAWDEPEASMDRTVDAHIKTLRSKLRAVRSDVDAIITHRGMGYALREEW